MADPNISTIEPLELVAGDTWDWKRELSDYLPSAWNLWYFLRPVEGGQTIDIQAGTDPENAAAFLISKLASDTANYGAGEYTWQAVVKDIATGLKRFQVATGSLKVLPNLEVAQTGIDNRSHGKRMYDAVCAQLEQRSTRLQKSYEVQAGSSTRKIEFLTYDELIRAKSYYAGIVRQEQIKSGQIKNPSRDLNIRFTS
jgi:hypothetical protein